MSLRWLIEAPPAWEDRGEARKWILQGIDSLPPGLVEVDLDWWRSEQYDPYRLDRELGDASEAPLQQMVVRTREPQTLEPELARLLIRLQGRFPSVNRASSNIRFRHLLQLHRKLHNLNLPLVRADFIHAIDTWQWVLRLEPKANEVVQAAALLHDLERLQSESRKRHEHKAPDYQTFKDAHAHTGARMVRQLLLFQSWSPSEADAVARLVERHESSSSSVDLQLLSDADALSFFSVNSAGYLDYFGERQCRKKIVWTLARMSPRAGPWLAQLRLRSDVEALYQSLRARWREGEAKAADSLWPIFRKQEEGGISREGDGDWGRT